MTALSFFFFFFFFGECDNKKKKKRVHRVGLSHVFQLLLEIEARTSVMASPAWFSLADMLSILLMQTVSKMFILHAHTRFHNNYNV